MISSGFSSAIDGVTTNDARKQNTAELFLKVRLIIKTYFQKKLIVFKNIKPFLNILLKIRLLPKIGI